MGILKFCKWLQCQNLGKNQGKDRNRRPYCNFHYKTQSLLIRRCDYCKNPLPKNSNKWCLICRVWMKRQENKRSDVILRKHIWYSRKGLERWKVKYGEYFYS